MLGDVKLSSNSLVGCVALRLVDPLFESVGYDLDHNKLFLKADGDYFILECRKVDAFEIYKKGSIANYLIKE